MVIIKGQWSPATDSGMLVLSCDIHGIGNKTGEHKDHGHRRVWGERAESHHDQLFAIGPQIAVV